MRNSAVLPGSGKSCPVIVSSRGALGPCSRSVAMTNIADAMQPHHPTIWPGIRTSPRTQGQAITGCDFSDSKGVPSYVEGDLIARSRTIGCQVAEQVQTLLGSSSRS